MPTAVKIADRVYNIPLIEELTIKDVLALRKLDSSSHAALLRWAFGCDPVLDNSKLTERQLTNVFALIDGLIADVSAWFKSDERIAVPKTIELLGLTVKFRPGLVNELPYWGTVRCKTVIQEELELQKTETPDFTDRIPEVLAHYLYALVTKNPYDEAKADDFIDVVMSLNMKLAIQAGNFFLLKQLPYFQSNKDSLATRLTVMSKRLGLRFLKSLATLTTWKRSAVEIY